MSIFAGTRYLFSRIVLVLAIFLADGRDASAVLVIDFSPDTTSATSTFLTGARQNFLPGQIIGDRFTLSEDTVLTGGSIFSDDTVGMVGNAVRFLVFEDNAFTTPILDINTTLDAVDASFTTSESSLTRKHALITPTPLSAGTYWFSMPGNGLDIRQGITTAGDGYDDGIYRKGTTNLEIAESSGDMYFQLESVPEPAAFVLAAIGILSLLSPRFAARFCPSIRTLLARGEMPREL